MGILYIIRQLSDVKVLVFCLCTMYMTVLSIQNVNYAAVILPNAVDGPCKSELVGGRYPYLTENNTYLCCWSRHHYRTLAPKEVVRLVDTGFIENEPGCMNHAWNSSITVEYGMKIDMIRHDLCCDGMIFTVWMATFNSLAYKIVMYIVICIIAIAWVIVVHD